MKCCSRSTLGVVVGILNVLFNIGLIIFSIYLLTRIDTFKIQGDGQLQNERALKTTILSVVIVVCLVMTIISGLFIVGIVKRRHKLMLPWLILSWLGFILNCGSFIIQFLKVLFMGVTLPIVYTLLLFSLFGYAISGLILWAIFTLFRDIRQDNIEKRRLGRGADLLECNQKTGI